jgi:hypothetical protein
MIDRNEWRSCMTNRQQISVPLPAELRAFVERQAEAEDRSIASVIRRLVAEAARTQATQGERAASA